MAKPRKMLGRHDLPSVQALMRLIDEQSRETVARFGLAQVRTWLLPFYEARFGTDTRLTAALHEVARQIEGKDRFQPAKQAILAVHAAAREAADEPVRQAALRAIGQGLSAMHTPTHVLGLLFYGSAAAAYDQFGVGADAATLNQAFEACAAWLTDRFKAVSVADEPHPCRPNWYC